MITDYAFWMPDSRVAGWTTFRLVNNGGQPRMAQLIRLRPHMTLEHYLKAYAEAFRTAGPQPEWSSGSAGTGTATHSRRMS